MHQKIIEFHRAIDAQDWEVAQQSIKTLASSCAPSCILDSMIATLENEESRINSDLAKHSGSPSRLLRRSMRRHGESAPKTPIQFAPLVSIIIVSFNSSKDLTDLFPSIAGQTYTNFEVILVENGQEDNKALASNHFRSFTYIRNQTNLGYAEANNIGASASTGEYLLLLNPDTTLDPYALKELLRLLSQESETALAATPKIFFAREFLRIDIKKCQESTLLDFGEVNNNLDYKKIFVRKGQLANNGGTYIMPSRDGIISLDVPMPTRDENIVLRAISSTAQEALPETSNNANNIAGILHIGGSSSPAKAVYFNDSITLSENTIDSSLARRLINNAGSGITAKGSHYDRGFGIEDCSELCTVSQVDAFCGCCVLIHRSVWLARKIFLSHFFAYFEDSELSHWIKSHNYNILYCPTSIIYHRHSESTQEKSPNWNYLVDRGRLLYEAATNPCTELATVKSSLAKLSNESISPQLKSAIDEYYPIESMTLDNLSTKQSAISVGIYNSYWSTYGGGEKHALDIASLISSMNGFDVYLISENDFCIANLSKYFGVDLSRVRRLRLSEVTTCVTGFFNIFINSTYKSLLVPRADFNYYIVSFPSRTIPKAIKNLYIFLHNSSFTAHWSMKWWGEHRHKILNPVLGLDLSAANQIRQTPKEKLIISIGRFNYEGHCKNHHLLIRAFNNARSQSLIGDDWKLVVAGSVNFSQQSSIRHLEDCLGLSKQSQGAVSLLPNASHGDIRNLYLRAFAYFHTAGMDTEPDSFPEKCEHFGISVYESVLYGCLPVVHNSGGPVEIAKLSDYYFLFSDINELALLFADIDSLYSSRSGQWHETTAINSSSRAQHHAQAQQRVTEELFQSLFRNNPSSPSF